MKARLPSVFLLLMVVAAAPIIAQDRLDAPGLGCRNMAAPEMHRDHLDGMPIPGYVESALVKKLRPAEGESFRSGATKEGADAATGVQRQIAPPIFVTIRRGDEALKIGDRVTAAQAYREALRDSFDYIPSTDQAIADSFIVCFKLIETAKAAAAAGERDLAREIFAEARTALLSYQQHAPGWNPKVVAHKIEVVEKLLASLQ